MFDVSVSEILVILFVGLLFIKAEEIPYLLKKAGGAIGKIRDLYQHLQNEINIFTSEKQNKSGKYKDFILGDDGKYHQVFPISKNEQIKKDYGKKGKRQNKQKPQSKKTPQRKS